MSRALRVTRAAKALEALAALAALGCALLLGVASNASAAAPATPQAPPPARSLDELRAQLDTVLRETHTPGVSVAIVTREGPQWVGGLGLADVAARKPVTADTLFRIGSSSKAFTSLALLQLEAAGKLSLQDPVRRIVPEVAFENRWEATDPVRVVDLVEHTTGWDDTTVRELAVDANGWTLARGLAFDPRSRTSRWRPGTRMAYCNSGLGVAGAVIEKLTGGSFEDYVGEHVLRPIGMRTATYLPPPAGTATTLYHADGVTPYPYWHVLMRPAGAVNASANDMAAYLQFYLNRGAVGGVAVVSPDALTRMEAPTRAWSAQAGLAPGYGLSNYWRVAEGRVWHGHNGGVPGGLTDVSYDPAAGIAYYYSVNSSSGEAFEQIGKRVRAYLTRELPPPAPPAAIAMPAGAAAYAGWYLPDSPRTQMLYFTERLSGLTRVAIDGSTLRLGGLLGETRSYLPVSATQLRRADAPEHVDPIATLVLLPPNDEGRFVVQSGMATLRQIPAALAWLQTALLAWVVLALASVVVYAPFWLLGGLFRTRRPGERALRAWPLAAVAAIGAVVGVATAASDDLLVALGTLSVWSATLCAATLLFAVASLAHAYVVWRRPAPDVRRAVRIHAGFVAGALLVATAYLAWYGFIGIRTWA